MERALRYSAVIGMCLLLCWMTGFAAEKTENNVTWTLDDGTLTVFCEGVCNGVPLTDDEWRTVRTIVFTEGVTAIGEWAFSGYSNSYEEIYQYTSVVLPEGLLVVDYAAFSFVETLATIHLPNSLTELGYGAFCNSGLTSAEIPAGITRIEEATFEGCPLVSVTIPDTVTSIGAYAFRDTLLQEVRLPASLLELGEAAFACCPLTAVVLPEGVTEIGAYAFWKCDKLTAVHLPASLINIQHNAFYDCPKELRFTVAEASESFLLEDGVLLSKDKKTLIYYPADKTDTSYTVPAEVETIRESAFRENDFLTEVLLPEGLKEIGGLLFSGCDNLKSITLPESVSKVQEAGAIPGTSNFFGIGSHGFGPFYGSSIQEITVFGRETNIIIAWLHGTDGFAKDATIYCYPHSATDVALRFNEFVGSQESVKVVYLEEDHEHIWTEECLQEPTCGAYGEMRRTCTVCAYTYIEPIPKVEHTYGLPKVNSVSYVKEDHAEYTCTVCGAYELIKVLDIEHEHEWTETVLCDSTASAGGKRYRTCSICNRVKIVYDAEITHTFGETITVEPTCKKNGIKYVCCSVCGYQETQRYLAQLDHVFEGELLVSVSASCTTNGSGTRLCTLCSQPQTVSIPATGHSYGEWKLTKKPTLKAVGEEQSICVACGDVQSREVQKLTFTAFAEPYLPYLYGLDVLLLLVLLFVIRKKKR